MSEEQDKPSPAIDYLQLTKDGLWYNNPGLVQLLGLCPLLAVTNNVVNGIGLGIATLVILVISNASISFSRNWVRKEIRIPFYVLVIASNVTVIDLIMNAWLPQLHWVLGIFIPLIVTNCAIIGRAEAYASRNEMLPAIVDGIMMGIGFMIVLVALAALREIIGSGTLFINAEVMFGESAKHLTIIIFDDYKGFLLAILPPGAFLGMGFLIAFKNMIDQGLDKRKKSSLSAIPIAVENR
ncbi:MAG: electron transport complex subunit E [Cocleimonas sp.]|nr:electron transport complex subunit E [Cocleimonas sp.]